MTNKPLPDGWRWGMLPEVAQIIMGQSPPGNTYNEAGKGLPFFQGKAEFGEVHPTPVKWCTAPQRIAEVGDILMSVRAPVGPTNLAGERCCIGRGLAAIRPNSEKVATEFLLYYFRFIEPQLAAKGQGSTFTAIGKNDLHRLEIPLPPLPTQRRLADLLNRADALRRRRADADRRAADFLPALFTHTFGDPATNPRGWEVVRLGDVCKVQLGKMLSPKSRQGVSPRPYLRNANVQWGRLDLSVVHEMDFTDEEFQKFALRSGDVLVCEGGEVGRSTIWNGEIEGCCYQKALHRLRPLDARVNPVYLLYCLIFAAKTGTFNDLTMKATIAHLPAVRLKQWRFLLPPLSLQRRFAAQVEAFRAVRARQAAARARLDDLFQSLLHRAFAGDL